MVLVLAVGTSWAACAAVAATCCTTRCYCCIRLAALRVATVYCLLYVCEYGLLLLAIHIPERLAAACYLLWHLRSFLTKSKTRQETYYFRQMQHLSCRCKVLTKTRRNGVVIRDKKTCYFLCFLKIIWHNANLSLSKCCVR